VDDIAAGFPDGRFHGHGTQVAILAAGCKTGVARKANLYLVKVNEVVMNSGLTQRQRGGIKSLLMGLHHVVAIILGARGISIPKGKAIVVVCSNVARLDFLRQTLPEQMYNALVNDYKEVLGTLDRFGATVIMAAGNGGSYPGVEQNPDFVPSYVGDTLPQNLATKDSPIIVVGSTNNKGQLSSFTSPGRGDTPITVYAQGEDVTSYDFLHGTDPWPRSGTSFAAPIVVSALDQKCIVLSRYICAYSKYGGT
jgi:hypothetical protein